MNNNITFILRVIQKEVWARRRLVIFFYIVSSIVFLAAAWTAPRGYTSSSRVFVDRQNILPSLLAGTAVATEVADQGRLAREIVFSRNLMEKVVKSEIWSEEGQERDAKSLDLMINNIKSRTAVEDAGNNLIEISYKDSDAERAFKTTGLLTQLYIDESLKGKQKESRSAYEFINQQAQDYRQKLKDAEVAIKEFRSSNIDASPSAKANANARLIEIKRELEVLDIDISSQETILSAISKQLAGESGAYNKASLDRENQLNSRIISLENRLEDLKLNYHDTYPDIVQLKGQIEALREKVAEELENRMEMARQGKTEVPTGATARDLRSQILSTETNIKTLKNKRDQLVGFINKERETLESINAVEAREAELTRDYRIHQNMYQNLLDQREQARISMNIDINNQGLTLKVQEEPSLPTAPEGVRFLHIILAGLVLSFLVPVGLVYGLTLIDQKVRSSIAIRENCRLPILASVRDIPTPKERNNNYYKIAAMGLIILSVWSVYAYAAYLKWQSYSL